MCSKRRKSPSISPISIILKMISLLIQEKKINVQHHQNGVARSKLRKWEKNFTCLLEELPQMLNCLYSCKNAFTKVLLDFFCVALLKIG